jgi:hypothetical protein
MMHIELDWPSHLFLSKEEVRAVCFYNEIVDEYYRLFEIVGKRNISESDSKELQMAWTRIMLVQSRLCRKVKLIGRLVVSKGEPYWDFGHLLNIDHVRVLKIEFGEVLVEIIDSLVAKELEFISITGIKIEDD